MRRIFLFVILAMALIHIATPAELPAQESGTKRFDDIKGTRVLTAAHEKSNVFVTVSHTDDKRSCFMVENIVSGVKNKFYTTEHVVPSMFYTCSGYIVNDIKIEDNYTCWFCGTKWVRTGNYVYNIEGLLVPDTQWYGYIGKFPINYAMSGSGNYSIMIIPNSHKLEHFAMTDDGGFYATEESLIYHIFPDATGYSVECGRIEHSGAGGRFMGVECAGDTVIALSVCADSGHYFHYHDLFYLSYGLTGDFITHDTTHIFDTYYAYGDRRVRRWSAQPLFLTKTNRGSGVTVSYITENTDYPEVDFPGKMIMFHIPDRWNVRPTVIHTDDTGLWQTHQWRDYFSTRADDFYILPYTIFNSHSAFRSFQFESTAVGTTSMCSEQLPKNN